MGWLFALILFMISWITDNDMVLIASGLYAIAGAIAFAFNNK